MIELAYNSISDSNNNDQENKEEFRGYSEIIGGEQENDLK